MKKIALVMGSDSDLGVMSGAVRQLKAFGAPFEVRIISAHRTPRMAEEFASTAREKGFGAIIAAAGKAAHLAGVLAAYTTLPVIAVPIKASALEGLDALLAMVQMPKGIPVATVAIDGADNAALLALQILAVSDDGMRDKLEAYKAKMAEEVARKDAAVADAVAAI